MMEVIRDKSVVGMECPGIYVASRASLPQRPAMWRQLRDDGWPIISTWIDESGDGETADFGELWQRITDEITRACGVVLYAEQDDFPLKGALLECGIALGMGKRVAVVIPMIQLEGRSLRPVGSWLRHPLVKIHPNLPSAREWVSGGWQRASAPLADAMTDEEAEDAIGKAFQESRKSVPQVGYIADADRTRLESRIASLFDAVGHGDDEHRAWLKQAIEDHFAGRPVSPVTGKGTKETLESRIKELEAELAEANKRAEDRDEWAGKYSATWARFTAAELALTKSREALKRIRDDTYSASSVLNRIAADTLSEKTP